VLKPVKNWPVFIPKEKPEDFKEKVLCKQKIYPNGLHSDFAKPSLAAHRQ
jgi:hypothetical protein